MSRIAIGFSRTGLAAALLALLASMAPRPAYALAPTEAATPPVPTGERLEQIWAGEQKVYARLGTFFDNADARIEQAQQRIDRLEADGKDVTALQAALDDLAAAVKQARPIYEGGKGIRASHQGFDGTGSVTDFSKALGTVRDMGSRLRAVRQAILPAVRALREAVREFRAANRAFPTATPGGV